MESEIVRVVSLSITEISKITQLKIFSSGSIYLKTVLSKFLAKEPDPEDPRHDCHFYLIFTNSKKKFQHNRNKIHFLVSNFVYNKSTIDVHLNLFGKVNKTKIQRTELIHLPFVCRLLLKMYRINCLRVASDVTSPLYRKCINI